jgi:hypothetical protein
MSATYDPAWSRDLDQIRKRLADLGDFDPDLTHSAGPVAIVGAINSDDELTAWIAGYGIQDTIKIAANAMAAFYIQEPNNFTQANGVTVSYADRAKAMRIIAQEAADSTPTAANYRQTTSVGNDIAW